MRESCLPVLNIDFLWRSQRYPYRWASDETGLEEWEEYWEERRSIVALCAQSLKKIFNWGGALSAVIELESETDSGSVPF